MPRKRRQVRKSSTPVSAPGSRPVVAERKGWTPARMWIQSLITVAVVLLASETFLLLGVVAPVAIEGSSMAPALLGPHVDVECPHCQWTFAVGGDQLPAGRPLVCPDCRRGFHHEQVQTLQPGRRVWVDRTRIAFRRPGRWEVVVFRCPENATSYCVKRIVGLPGEHVDFATGDLQIDGAVLRKSLAEQQTVRQLVHRERQAFRQWQPHQTHWVASGDAWAHRGPRTSALGFQPADGVAVTDDLAVNQRATRRLNTVTDLMVTCTAEVSPDASIQFVATFEDGSAVRSPPATVSGRELTWSLFDRQAMLAVDDTVVWRKPFGRPWPGPPELSIAATGEVALKDLCVWRDVYYHTRPADRWPHGGVTVPAEEFFVVGDNVAISVDSRSWAHAGLPKRLIIGIPLRP